LHLGTRGCKAELLLNFLKHHDSDFPYLIGDVIDGWALRNGFFWPQAHNDVVQKILRRARKGTKVVYVPGNHDEFAGQFAGLDFGGIAIRAEAEHELLDGRRLWIVHVAFADGIIQHARWLAYFGSVMYRLLLRPNHWVSVIRSLLGWPYWSLSRFPKLKVKNAVNFIFHFEQLLVREAKRRGFDGVVCGHIHRAELREVDGLLYCNDGDWVESVTALVETWDGRLQMVHWPIALEPEDLCFPLAASEPELERELIGA
jgi:UDP-2,3-diacylglucosamine pyrophosphatase LpxH